MVTVSSTLNHVTTIPTTKELTTESSACTGTWVIHSSCSCCHGYCTRDAFMEAYDLTHGSCTVGNTCCTSGQSPIQWTSSCKTAGIPLQVRCSYLNNTCTISARNVYCTCPRNTELDATCHSTIQPNEISSYIAFIGLLPLVIIILYGIKKYTTYRSENRRNTDDSQEANVPVTTIYVKCNILLVVGDRDELKVISDQLEAAIKSLAKTKNRLKLTRIGIFHLYADNYSIECDKAIFLLDLVAQSTDNRLAHCKEKIRYTKGESNSVSIVYMGKITDQQSSNTETVQPDPCFSIDTPRPANREEETRVVNHKINPYEISLTSNPREIGNWLPFVTKVTFGIDRKFVCIGNLFRQRRFFSLKILSKDNRATETLKNLLDGVLTSCGAQKTDNEDRISCNIYVVDNFGDDGIWSGIMGMQNVYIFSAANSRLEEEKCKNITASLYRKDEMITGLYEVLHLLQVIK